MKQYFESMKSVVYYILTGVILLFIFKTVYYFYQIFEPPSCSLDDICYKSVLNDKPELDLYVYVSDNSESGNFEELFRVKKFNYTSPFEREVLLGITETSRNNGTIFIDSVLVPSKTILKKIYFQNLKNAPGATYITTQLTTYTIPASATFNLSKENTSVTQTIKPVTHLRSKFGITMCTDHLNLPHSHLPPEIVLQMRIVPEDQFLPLLEHDIYTMKLEDLVEITPETRQLNFTFFYKPRTLDKFRFMLRVKSFINAMSNLGFTEIDIDSKKGFLAHENQYLLIATIFFGVISILLDFLSFGADVHFWKSRTSLVGLSTRTVLWTAYARFVYFLYLLDDDTVLMVLIVNGIQILLEFWKVSKILKTSFSWKGVTFIEQTNEEKRTREYEEECMKYLSPVLYPLFVAAVVYSLIYVSHKSWYSWTINSIHNGIYAFGFLSTVPQLFINYRLKSVVDIHWITFLHITFNTFIVDFMAFILTTTTAYKMACFRDDIIFLIYMYQRWLYPVDGTRIVDVNVDNIQESDLQEKKTK